LNPDIFSLEQVSDSAMGGKAYGLSRLTAMGLPVPPAFIIRNALIGSYPGDLDERYLALECEKVAVRSSAQGEDGADASFAGQYETVLNVAGATQLRQAIDHCVASAGTDRARAYQQDQPNADMATMNVVVQRMVDARVAGVVFTADPVSARRDLLVIDAVAGLGEALVSGEATPDHYCVNRSGDIVRRQLTGDAALLSDLQIARIAQQARAAAAHEGHPLDLEWAIDQAGVLFWLQARPVTTLPADLNEFDAILPRPDDVLTISNVSEMMPGAVCPLTMSFTGWGIDYGLQHMQVTVGARERIQQSWQITASAYGHLFLNLTGNVVMSA
jgi:pyruvate,water dikinase